MGRRETYTLAKISGRLGGADMLGWSEHGHEERPVGESVGRARSCAVARGGDRPLPRPSQDRLDMMSLPRGRRVFVTWHRSSTRPARLRCSLRNALVFSTLSTCLLLSLQSLNTQRINTNIWTSHSLATHPTSGAERSISEVPIPPLPITTSSKKPSFAGYSAMISDDVKTPQGASNTCGEDTLPSAT